MAVFKKKLSKDSKVLFLITSSIHTAWGNNEIARFSETISTINSINANFNNAEIWLIDASFKKISEHLLKTLPENVILKDFLNDKNIKNFMIEAVIYSANMIKAGVSKDLNKDLKLIYVKNRTESYIFKDIITKNSLLGYDRIFKLSGRYVLSPNFNIKQHNAKNKYVFLESVESNQKTLSIDRLYRCFCWSFDEYLLNKTRKAFIEIEKEIKESFNNKKYADLEHFLYNKLKKDVVEVKEMGIFANVGEKGHVYR
jgi:hypothetical protein